MNEFTKWYPVLGLSIGLCSQPLLAAEPDADTLQLDAVQVWGTEVRSSSTYLSNDSFATKQADHISDLLRPLPGVDVGGAHSLNQRITIRSMDDKDLMIRLDGAVQNNYMYHHMGNLQIDANILKSADVQVGNNSVINGGLGGAVRFETKSVDELLSPDQLWGAHFQASYNDNASRSLSATGYGKIAPNMDILGYFKTLDRDNFEVGGGEIKNSAGQQIAGTDGTVRGLEGQIDNALVKFGWDITPNQRMVLGYESYVDEGDYSYRPDMGSATDYAIANNTNTPLTYPTEYTRDTLTLNYELMFGSSGLLELTLFNNKSEFSRDERALAPATVPPIAAAAGVKSGVAENSGVLALATNQIEGAGLHQLSYGFELTEYNTEYNASLVSGANSQNEEEATDMAFYLEDRWELNNGLAIIPGIRYNQYDIDSTLVDDSFDEITAAFAAEYNITPAVLLRASTTQLFKGPELGEVFTGAGLGDEANPDIQAETGLNSELFLGFQDQVGGLDRLQAGITLFVTTIDDFIYDNASPSNAAPGFSWKDNVGDMKNRGFEAYVGVDKGGFSLLYTLAKANSKLAAFDDYEEIDGARLDREQGLSHSLGLDYEFSENNLSLHWDILLVDDLDDAIDLDGAGTNRSKDGYSVHNVSVRWLPRSVTGLELTFGIDNLFDEYYASQASRTGVTTHPVFGELFLLDYEPGRNIKTTVAYRF